MVTFVHLLGRFGPADEGIMNMNDSGASSGRVSWMRRAATALAITLVAACSANDDTTANDGGPPDDGASGDVPIPTGEGVHGVTDDTIKIGLVQTAPGTNSEAVNSAAGTDLDAAEADMANAQLTVVDYINENGGMAGRQVEPVFYFFDTANYFSPSGRQQENQRACATFTEDEQVFAFVTVALSEELILDCSEQSETPMVSVYYHAYPSEDRVEQMSDFWYAPDNFTAERRERTLVDFLDGLDWFDDDPNVAIMIEDKPGIREGVEDGLKPTLEDLGIEPALEIVYPDFYESPWPNYILQLQSAEVTHVIFSASTQPGFAALSMMKAAEEQGYRPQWAGGSDTGFAALPQLGAPVEQMLNYTGMGWEPGYFDTGDFDTPQSEAGELCKRLMDSAGEPVNAGAPVCEYLFFLKAALDAAPEISPAGLAAGVEGLGDTHAGVLTLGGGMSFGPGKHDGIAVVQRVAYDEQTSLMEYIGEPIEVE
jgi:ABC-type branched-subunit amino acid transport system substrate-binding protein